MFSSITNPESICGIIALILAFCSAVTAIVLKIVQKPKNKTWAQTFQEAAEDLRELAAKQKKTPEEPKNEGEKITPVEVTVE